MPKDKDEITWAGEAYIDTEEFEPVRVFTKLAQRIPLMVRVDDPAKAIRVLLRHFTRDQLLGVLAKLDK